MISSGSRALIKAAEFAASDPWHEGDCGAGHAAQSRQIGAAPYHDEGESRFVEGFDCHIYFFIRDGGGDGDVEVFAWGAEGNGR